MTMMRAPVSESKAVNIKELNVTPYFKINISHIKKNGKLLSKHQIIKVKQFLQDKPDGRYSKKDFDFPLAYGIIKQGEQYFAIYYGESYGKLLGKGSYGKVKIAQNLDSGEHVALKVQEHSNEPYVNEQTEQEALILAEFNRLKAPLILRMKPNRIKYNILMNYFLGIDAFDFLELQRTNTFYKPKMWCDLVIGMLKSVQAFHEKGWFHCDIKPENFLFEPFRREVHLIDFGFALKREAQAKTAEINVIRGTLPYIAPENKRAPYEISEATEAYAMGLSISVILGILSLANPASGYPFKYDANNCEHRTGLQDNREIINFLMLMTSLTPSRRPSFQEAVEFFQGMRNQFSCQETIGVMDVSEYFKEGLRSVDRVVLIDVAEEPQIKDSLWTINHLEKAGIIVHHSVYFGTDRQALLEQLPQKIEDEEKFDKPCQFFFFTKKHTHVAVKTMPTIPIVQGEEEIHYHQKITSHIPSIEEKAMVLPNKIHTRDIAANLLNVYTHLIKSVTGSKRNTFFFDADELSQLQHASIWKETMIALEKKGALIEEKEMIEILSRAIVYIIKTTPHGYDFGKIYNALIIELAKTDSDLLEKLLSHVIQIQKKHLDGALLPEVLLKKVAGVPLILLEKISRIEVVFPKSTCRIL